MKSKLLPVIIILFSAFTSQAQIQKGDWLLGATMGYNSSDYSSSSTANANISPRIGYAVSNNWMLGVRLGFGHSNTKSDGDDSKNSINNFEAALFARKYIPLKNKLGWYAEAGAGIATGSSRYKAMTIDTKQTSLSFNTGIKPGLYYQALPNLLVSVDVGGIRYSYGKNKYEGQANSHTSNFSMNFLQGFNFGVDFILGKS